MFSDLLTRLFRDSPDSHDEEAEDPGFATFMATLHARRSAQEWYTPGPEGDLYRQRCRDEEMMRLESRNYGFVMKSPSVSSKETESTIAKRDGVSLPDGGQQPKRWKRSKLLRGYSSERPKRVSSIGS